MLLATVRALALVPALIGHQQAFRMSCDDGCAMPENEPDPVAFVPGELTVLSLPSSPDTSLSAVDVVETVW